MSRAPDAGGDFLLEVKYRTSIEQFVTMEMQRGDRSTFALARRQFFFNRLVRKVLHGFAVHQRNFTEVDEHTLPRIAGPADGLLQLG